MVRALKVCLAVLVFPLMIATVYAGPADDNLWAKFETTRQSPQVLYQEFEVTQRVNNGYRQTVWHYDLKLDLSQGKWREQSLGARNDRTRIFDSQNLYEVNAEETEYAHIFPSTKDAILPEPYDVKVDWRKATQQQTLPCGFSGKDHTCVVVEAPMKPWIRPSTPGSVISMKGGMMRAMIDSETGAWLHCQIVATVDQDFGPADWVVTYNIKQMGYAQPADKVAFKLPDNLHQVDKFERWDDTVIKKELGGKAAPSLQVKDLRGNPISIADLKGKTVLLDFWTTWCPPCQADSPNLEKLNQQYGKTNLAIVGISMNEDREIVEKYLRKHPRSYPVVLSSENQLPPSYQVSIFPTYLIINPDGTLAAAEEGDQGFAKLRKDLEKAGMSTQ